jgi:hypothetical protein
MHNATVVGGNGAISAILVVGVTAAAIVIGNYFGLETFSGWGRHTLNQRLGPVVLGDVESVVA